MRQFLSNLKSGNQKCKVNMNISVELLFCCFVIILSYDCATKPCRLKLQKLVIALPKGVHFQSGFFVSFMS